MRQRIEKHLQTERENELDKERKGQRELGSWRQCNAALAVQSREKGTAKGIPRGEEREHIASVQSSLNEANNF